MALNLSHRKIFGGNVKTLFSAAVDLFEKHCSGLKHHHKAQETKVSLCLTEIIADSVDRLRCNRGTVILSWVGTWVEEEAFKPLTDHKGLLE